MFFKGLISLIFDPKIVCNMMMNDPRVRVINLDEDNSVPMLCDDNNPQAVPGTILLPPIEANWAIVDDNMDMFRSIYRAHMLDPNVMQYVATILAAAYQGYHVILFFPDENHEIIKWLYNFFISDYGIVMATDAMHPFLYQNTSIPAYCNAIMSIHAISPYEYLYWYPNDAVIPSGAYMDIIAMLKIPGDCIADKMKLVDSLRKMIKVSKKAKIPFQEVQQCQ